MTKEQEPKLPEPGFPVYSPWFPRTGTVEVSFETRPDPDPDSGLDGCMVEGNDKLIRLQILPMPEADPDAGGGSWG